MKKDFDMQNIGVFLFLSVFSLFCSKEDLKSKKYGVVLFSPSVLKTKSSVDTIRRTVRLIMNVIAFLLLIFWLFSGCFRLFLIMTRELQDVCVILSRIAPPFQTMNPISFFSSSLISSMNLAGLALRL